MSFVGFIYRKMELLHRWELEMIRPVSYFQILANLFKLNPPECLQIEVRQWNELIRLFKNVKVLLA